MPGSAVLGSSFMDQLVECLDECRAAVHEDIGDRQYRVFTVLRTWTGDERGDGDFNEVETELLPRPKVESLKGHDRLLAAGLDEADVVRLRYVSLTYTEAEISGPPLAANQQWTIRLKDAYGQQSRTRDFVPATSPWPDRVKDIGWTVNLERASDLASAAVEP